MILKLLRAYPEKLASKAQKLVKREIFQQCMCGAYQKGSYAKVRFDLLVEWRDFLVDLCFALGTEK